MARQPSVFTISKSQGFIPSARLEFELPWQVAWSRILSLSVWCPNLLLFAHRRGLDLGHSERNVEVAKSGSSRRHKALPLLETMEVSSGISMMDVVDRRCDIAVQFCLFQCSRLATYSLCIFGPGTCVIHASSVFVFAPIQAF